MATTIELIRRLNRSALAQAGLAIGVAGAGRIVLNSVISAGFGTLRFAQYASLISSIMLWASLASAGPAAAVTLSVARNWGRGRGTLTGGLLRFLLRLSCLFLGFAIIVGLWFERGDRVGTLLVWLLGISVVVAYQAGRSLGYAVEAARVVTVGELVGSAVPLAAVASLLLWWPQAGVNCLALAFLLGPIGFLAFFGRSIRSQLKIDRDPVSAEERRLAVRATTVFTVGAGSSMAMMYLPIIIADRLALPAATGVLFGALQATTPLLLFSRVYGTVMMPAFAATQDASQPRRHVDLIEPLYLPTLTIALGLAPWVVVALTLRPDPLSVAISALVALTTLMQVWATPAVTILSSRKRELIPAMASLGGLVAATVCWAIAVELRSEILLPVGLAVGGLVRSLVPMWIYSGCILGFQPRILLRCLVWLLIALSLGWASRTGSGATLLWGSVLLLGGGIQVVRSYRTIRRQHSHPAR